MLGEIKRFIDRVRMRNPTATNPGVTNLFAWWTLDETGEMRYDSQGESDLTKNNTVGYATGLKGNAASFVAAATPANQKSLSASDRVSLSTGDINFTLIANVYLNSTSKTFVILDKSDNASAYDYRIGYNPGTGFRFRVGSGPAYVDSGDVSPNAWYTVIAWHNAAVDKIYIQVNNGPVQWKDFSAGTVDTNQPLSIGALPNGAYGLDGRVDEVALYRNRLLTAAERTWIYNDGKGRTYADVNPSAPPTWHENKYSYSPSIPHAVTSVNRGSFTDTFKYDENGNMTCRTESGVTYRQNYNAENRISSIAKINGACNNTTAEILEAWSYTYDGDGVRVSTAHFTGMSATPDSFTRYYFGGAYETSDDGTWKKYYSFAGQTVAMRDANGFKYFLSDHLGSTSVVLDANGAILEQQRYLPFGQVRVMPPFASVTSTDFIYTGQRNLPDTGLMDYRARFYSPSLGRFIQPDTIIPGVANPQSWNRFSYVTNNPLRYTDPTGHMQASDDYEDDDGNCYNNSNWKSCYDVKAKIKKKKIENSIRAEVRQLQEAGGILGGPCLSVVCINQPESELDIPLDPRLQYLQSDSPSISNEIDSIVSQIEFGVDALNLLDLIEDGIQWGRPVYRQVKYAIPLGGYEYGADGLLQIYDDRNKSLGTAERAIRGVVRAGESFLTDSLSVGMGGLSAAALQATVPIPFVSAGVGYVVGSYSTSAILDNIFVKNINPYVFDKFLGGP